MKTQCALKILNRMLAQFPSIYTVARYLHKYLQSLVDQKSSIDGKLYTLALGCKSNLERKMLTMPDRPADAQIPLPAPAQKERGGSQPKKKDRDNSQSGE